MSRFVCLHGHFYQPPRENPWLEAIELQDSAYPYHDWNSRVTAECYAPNTTSRILDHDRRVIDIVNTFSKISFNFGPTLLSWMEKKEPEVYKAILDADRISQQRYSGHGAAIAQVYNHMIMPLATRKDKQTQICWGIADFQHRFQRKPEGMWLAETAVDIETLELLVDQGIAFTILSPRQAKRIKRNGGRWMDVSGGRIDPKRAYRYELPSGRSIALFFYDGAVAQKIAFGSLLDNGEHLAESLVSTFRRDQDEAQLVNVATDGETYGHHHTHGEMALAYCLYHIEKEHLAELSVYGEFLEKHPPTYQVDIEERTSWSCFHGIERWRSNCGCNSGKHQDWNQAWRGPLRGALDWLRDNLELVFKEVGAQYLKDPWQARDEYIEIILNRQSEGIERFLKKHASKELDQEQKTTVLKLLEMQRHAMLMYTSCAWFFDELSGIETVQVVQYACRAMQLAKDVRGVSFEEAFDQLLKRAPSNLPDIVDGSKMYDLYVKPAAVDLLRVGVHYAVLSLFVDDRETIDVYCYDIDCEEYDQWSAGEQKLIVGRVRIRSKITLEEALISFGVLYLGGHNLVGAARSFMGEPLFRETRQRLRDSFSRGDVADITRELEMHFESGGTSLWHLFRDEQRKVLDQVFDVSSKQIGATFNQIYDHQAAIMQVSENLHVPLPRPLAVVAEYVLNMELREALLSNNPDLFKVKKMVAEIKRFSLAIDRPMIALIVSGKVQLFMEEIVADPKAFVVLERAVLFLSSVNTLFLELNLWRSQNTYFKLGKAILPEMQEQAKTGQVEAQRWVKAFYSLGNFLKVRIS